MPQGFINVHAPDVTPTIGGDTRYFEGDGTPILRVPGLKTLHSVRMSRSVIPEQVMQKFPVDPQHSQHVNIPTQVVALDHLADGTPVLLRHICSNDGVFQSFEPFYVTGEWEEGVEAPEMPVRTKERPAKGIR